MDDRSSKTIDVAAAGAEFEALVEGIYQRRTRVRLERSGVVVAALVSEDDLRRLDDLDRARAERFRVIDEARAAFGDASPDEVDREADRAVSERRSGVAASA